jgi:hypothetical protein
MGIETFNRDAGKLVRKGMDPDRLKQGITDFEKYTDKNAPRRFRANIQLICGIPGETKDSWYESIDWLNTNWSRQSVSAWILEVPDFDDSLTNQSNFTKELMENGLIKLNTTEHPGYTVKKDKDGAVVFQSIPGGGVGSTRNKIVIWQHDTMNWHTADKLVQEFYSKDHNFLRGCNPFLSDRLFVYYKTDSYEDIYDKKISDVKTHDDVFKEFVQNYIENKLNWTTHV